ENDRRCQTGFLCGVGKISDELGLCVPGINGNCTRRGGRVQEQPGTRSQQAGQQNKREMEGHRSSRIVRYESERVNRTANPWAASLSGVMLTRKHASIVGGALPSFPCEI